MVFEPGSAVEVSIYGAVGLGTSWFSATIVSCFDSDTYLVQYPNVAEKATVSFHRLRPLPPPDTRRKFHWREGQITGELRDGRFVVSFGDSEDEDEDDSEEAELEEEEEMDLDDLYGEGYVSEELKTPTEKSDSESEEVDDSEDENVFPKELLRTHRQWINENWYPPMTHYNGRDLISELPDAVLLHIMNNFMFTKHAVRTCVLSKRWKNLSKRLTNLSFDGLHIICGRDIGCFKKFASWLHLPAIKTLRLNYVKFTCSTKNHSAEPFSNCHALHTLSLSNCYLHDDAQLLSISNSTLSNLTIFVLRAKQIVLSTRNLTSINVFASLPHQLSSKCTLSLLEEVDIDLWLEFYDGNAIMGWLQVLANVKILTMCARALLILHREFSNPISRKPQPSSFARLELLLVKQRDFATISNITFLNHICT